MRNRDQLQNRSANRPGVSHATRAVRWLGLGAVWVALLTGTVASAQPTLTKVFTPDTIGPGGVSMITFTITNGSGTPVTDLAFTDVLPTVPGDVDLASPANPTTSCPGGVVSAPDGGGTITFSDGSLGGFQDCTVTVNVTASTPGVHTNPAITLSSSAGSSMSLPVDLTVTATLPGFSKSFSPSAVALGGRSTLTFTIDNTANAARIGNLDFTDNLPVGMVVASPNNTFTDCVSAGLPDTTLTAVPGTSVIILDANGTNILAGFEVLPIGATCTATVDVVGTGAGMLHNVSDNLLADFTAAGKAVDTLEVTVEPLHLSKGFTDDPVPPGSMATLEFTINNFDRNFSATGITFTDSLAAALSGLVSTGLSSPDPPCGAGSTLTGTSLLTLAGGNLPPEGSCTFSVALAVPAGATAGTYTNTTSAITGNLDGSPVVGNMASDDLFLAPFPSLTKEFQPNPVGAGDTVVVEFTVTNTDPTSSATDITFSDSFPTILPTASVVPSNGDCGAGSTFTFLPLVNPPPPGGVTPATLVLSGGTLAPAGEAGDSCTFSITMDVLPTAAAGTYPNETTEITATVGGESVTGPPAQDALQVVAAPSLTKEFTDDPASPGGTVTLEFTLLHDENAPGGATNIMFSDDLAATLTGLTAVGLPMNDVCGSGSQISGTTNLMFTGGTLEPGESCTFSVTLNVPAGGESGTFPNTTSMVVATVLGLSATGNAGSDDLLVPGLLFSKEFLSNPVIAGGTTTLRFSIENVHPTEDATISSFSDNLNTALSGLTATGGATTNTCGGTLTGTTNLSYIGGSVSSGDTCTVEVELQVPAGAADDNYTNTTGNLIANQGGAVVVPPASAVLTVNSSLLMLTKEFTDDPVMPGDTVTLEFVLGNPSATDSVTGIMFTDDLDAALSGLSAVGLPAMDVCGAGSQISGTNVLSFTGGSLAASASCTFSVTLTVPGGAVSSDYVNTTSSVTGMLGALEVTADPATDELAVREINLTKSFENIAEAGGTVTLEFSIQNLSSTDTLTDLAFTDDLDGTLSGLAATGLPDTDICGTGSSITGLSFLTFSGGTLLPMGTCTFSVTLQVPATPLAGAFPNVTSSLRSGSNIVAPGGSATLFVTSEITNAVTVTADGADPAMDETTNSVTIAP